MYQGHGQVLEMKQKSSKPIKPRKDSNYNKIRSGMINLFKVKKECDGWERPRDPKTGRWLKKEEWK